MKDPIKDDGESPIHILWLPTIFAAGLAYVASPLDLIPGLGPIGMLDDIIFIIAMVWFFTSWLPKNSHRIYWFKPKAQQATGQGRSGPEMGAESAERAEFDPFDTLDLKPGATPDEIKVAYRRMLAKYHPDKVSHLGEEFQKIAHEKALDIQKAYEMLCGKG